MKIRNRAKALLTERGHTIKDFCKEYEVSYYSFYLFHKNRTANINTDILLKLCIFLDCSIGDILVLEK